MQKTCENQKRHLNSFDINITSDDILVVKETATLTKKAVDDSNNYTVEIQENISLHCDVNNKIQKVSTSWKGDNEAEEAGRKGCVGILQLTQSTVIAKYQLIVKTMHL